jgi:hypothetical protein
LDWLLSAQAQGHEIDELKDMPMLTEVSYPYWQAYFNLQSSSDPMGNGAIPVSEIYAYLKLSRIESTEDRLDYVRFINHLSRTQREYDK